MGSLQAQITELSRQVAAQARLISRLCKEVEELRARLLWQPLETFEPFPKLPLELRRLIWRYALPGPRLVTVIEALSSPDSGILFIDRCDGSGKVLASGLTRLQEKSAKPPPLLRVCRESRQVALGSYKFCFGTHVSDTSLLTEEFYSGSLFRRLAGEPLPPYEPPVVRTVPHAERTWAGVCFRPG
jgi:hypothetical protein